MHDHHGHTRPTLGQLPTDTKGLPDATRPRSSSSPTATSSTSRSPGHEADRRRDRADAGLQRLDPGPTLRIPQGSTVTVHVTNRGDLEATVHWHGLRLENRYDGTHDTRRRSRSARRSPTRSPSPTPARTGTTRTSARTTARSWACTGTSSSTPRTRLLAARPPRAAAHARRHPDRGRADRALRRRDDARGDGPVRQRHARRRRARPGAEAASRGEVVGST